jgi:branched-chain amino acid transport system substrate-binding protein
MDTIFTNPLCGEVPGKAEPMVTIIRAIIIVLIFGIVGCAPTLPPVTTRGGAPKIPSHPALQNAERAFDNGNYSTALDEYNAFLRQTVDGRFADAALFKIGRIYRLTGRGEDAIDVFSRLVREFPRSPLVADARLEILHILFDRKDYKAVITEGLAVTASPDPNLKRMPFFSLIADAYTALGDPLNAARYDYRAWNTAPEADSQTAWAKLKGAVNQLGADDLQQLVSEVGGGPVKGLLLYRLGMAYIMEEKYDDALKVLSTFVARFPQSPDSRDANNMILSLEARARFTPFTIGCLLPLSGPYAIVGQRALDGIELALSQVGQKAANIPFRIIVKDSRSDPAASVKAVDELDQDKVGAILGPMSASKGAAKEAQAKGIPIIVFTQRAGIPDIGPYVFRNFITPRMQVRALVSYAMDELGASRFAILYPDETYGRRFMNLFWNQVIDQGGVVNGVEAYDPEGTDFAVPIKKIAGMYYTVPRDLRDASLPGLRQPSPPILADTGLAYPYEIADPVERVTGFPLDRESLDDLGRHQPDRADQWHPKIDFDALFIPDAPKTAGLLIPQLAYYDVGDVYLLGTNLWNSKTLLNMSGDYMDNTLIVDGFFAGSQSEKVKRFVKTFQDVYGRAPGIIEALAYDSAMMVFQTMQQTATDSRRIVKTTLLQINDFDGVTGRTGFAQNGEAEKELQMLRIRGGRFVQVQRPTDAAVDNQ